MTAILVLLLLVQGDKPAALAQDQSSQAWFRTGVDAQQRGDLQTAADAYRRAVDADSRFAEAHANLGAVLARLGEYEQAVASYERALSLNPKLNAARVNLGLAHYRAGALSAAVDALKAAHASDPSLVQARQLLGLVLAEIGKDDEAIPHLEVSLQAAPQEPALLFALGRVYATRADPRADALAERLRQAPEGRAFWHQLRGLLLQKQDRHEQALAEYGAASALNDALPRLFVNIGVSRLALGDRTGARQAFEQALARSDRDGAAHLYLGWLDEQDERLADARRHAERAVAVEGDLAESQGLLGRILLKDGEHAAAVDHLARAVAAAPRNASWRFLLAQAYQRSGNAEAAAREFAEARRLKQQEVIGERK